MEIVDLNLKFRQALDPLPPVVDMIVQHHMAHPSWTVIDVHNYHKNTRGWNGIGYNYWIAFDGSIFKGRGLHYGAGVKGHNNHTLHVGYQGDFTKQKMTDAQLRSGIELNKWLTEKFNAEIVGHNDLAATVCPAPNFRMKELKEGVANVEQSDVSNWAKDAYNWVVENDISDGKRPKDPTTREELWTMLHRIYAKK